MRGMVAIKTLFLHRPAILAVPDCSASTVALVSGSGSGIALRGCHGTCMALV